MVRTNNNKIIVVVGVLLTIISVSTQAQSNSCSDFPQLDNYRKWGIVVGPVLYSSAEAAIQYGDYNLENLPMPGFNIGVEYDFLPGSRWSVSTAFILAMQPGHRVKYGIQEEDIFVSGYENYTTQSWGYSTHSYSFPLTLRFRSSIGSKSFYSFLAGFKVKYFPHGGIIVTQSFSSQVLAERREVFGIIADSPSNAYQGSFIMGAGFSHALERMLLNIDFVYVVNFQNILEGEYQFANLEVSPDTRGTYSLSGNYIGLLFTINLARSKKE